MIKIRKGVFETNSSSVHTIAIAKEGLEKPSLRVKRKKIDGTFHRFIYVPLGVFDKHFELFTTQEEKLSYIVTLAYMLDGNQSIENLKDKWNYEYLRDEILKYCNENGLNVEDFYIDPKTCNEAYIDHQTLSNYYSIDDFYSVMGLRYTDFVFNKYVALQTDCD